MKNNIKILFWSGLVLMLGLVSCEDYLDREPESILNEETAFRSFINFQSYTEELYHLLPDLAKHSGNSDYNWGEDMITSLNDRNRANVHIDNGSYRNLLGLWNCFLDRPHPQGGTWSWHETEHPSYNKSMWGPFWYGISKTNIGLANLDRLTDATQEEKNLIKGQLLFFRGLFHFKLIQYWGPMPYIGEVLPAAESPRIPRPTYHAVADSIAKDLREAVGLLPFHWDHTVAGQGRLNRWRINKAMALGYLTKNYLWAASPLMNRQSTGNASYETEYAKKAAAAAAELLKYVDSGETHHRLVPWENITDLFYTQGMDWLIPGSTEVIFQAPNYHAQQTNWSNSRVFAPVNTIGRDSPVYTPTANYVNYYGMANGLPLNHPESGFDPEYPWRDRDPRFYKDIIFDGQTVVLGALPPSLALRRYAHLHTGGNYRDNESGSRTGYLGYKWIPICANNIDVCWDQAGALTFSHSYMRLADIYLMYAEAAAIGYGSSEASDPGYSLTAREAINVIRARSGVGALASGLDLEFFMSELRRERAVELSFEGHRFNDLRRWLLLTVYPYNIKTRQEFDRAPDINYADPKNNRVVNFREEVILTRQLSDRHYWLPIRVGDANIYEGFPQNPGW
jgi:starch-binding outer membrane protein, SusD/RagB family